MRIPLRIQSCLIKWCIFAFFPLLSLMARGEHDRPDPTLIVEGSRRALPSKRIQGDDYPITPLEELRTRDKGKLTKYDGRKTICLILSWLGTAKASNFIVESTTKASVNRDLEDEATYLKDTSKPDGEACRDDGTLKDASEIEWLHSPSQNHPIIRGEKRKRDSGELVDSDSDNELPETIRPTAEKSPKNRHEQTGSATASVHSPTNSGGDDASATEGESEQEDDAESNKVCLFHLFRSWELTYRTSHRPNGQGFRTQRRISVSAERLTQGPTPPRNKLLKDGTVNFACK